jgi:hypothetical protein
MSCILTRSASPLTNLINLPPENCKKSLSLCCFVFQQSRKISTHQILQTIPPAFPTDQASKIFTAHDSSRLFAPTILKTKSLVFSEKSPLSRVFLPVSLMSVNVDEAHYTGQYGKQTTITVNNGKTTTTQTHTTYYYTEGFLPSAQYGINHPDMRVYAGYNQPASLVEDACPRIIHASSLTDFSKDKLEEGSQIDPFMLNAAVAQELVLERLQSNQESRAHSDIQSKHWTHLSRVSSINFKHDEIQMTHCMLPFYVLQYPGQPPRLLPAFGEEGSVTGICELSISKVMLASTILSGGIALFFPQAAISSRILTIAFSSLGSATWAKYRSDATNWFQKGEKEEFQQQNEAVAPTKKDRQRREQTQTFSNNDISKASPLTEEFTRHYKTLGLDLQKTYSKEDVASFFRKKAQKIHPDHNPGNDSQEEMRELITAYRAVSSTCKSSKKNSSTNFNSTTKRHFSTKITYQKVKEPPRSVYSSNANTLIKLVLVDKNYPKALQMIDNESVHVDAHNKGENTLLTEATKRGDLKGMEFALNKLEASPDTSCDCPDHRTALHYAAMTGNEKAVTLLLKYSAQVNLITSSGSTALDLAREHKHTSLCLLLENHGGLENRKLQKSLNIFEQAKRFFFGYSSKERTTLLEENKTERPRIEK